MNTTPTHPFHYDIARKCGWPLVTRDGRKAEVLKWDGTGPRSLIVLLSPNRENSKESISRYFLNGFYNDSGETHEVGKDLFLSADYSSPAVRAAVQRAHEELGMGVANRPHGYGEWLVAPPEWTWLHYDYRLAIHLPDPIAPEEPKKLPEDWCRELNITVMDPDGWDRKNFEKDWNIPLTRAEFNSKASRSTIQRGKYIPSRFAKPDPYAELKAAHAAGKVIETNLYGSWMQAHYPTWSLLPDSYRIKPSWSLSRHLSGFRALRDGEEWHRLNWTKKMLPKGWRPLIRGEKVQPGDEHEDAEEGFREAGMTIGWEAKEANITPHRTRRPLPEPPTPRDLTTEDLEEVDGLRFKDPNGLDINALWYPTRVTNGGVDFGEILSVTHTNLRLRGWLYRGNGVGWRKCEKEGK